jgi:O-antigen ligase
LLASRGALIAFLLAVIVMAPKLIPGKALKGSFAIAVVLSFTLCLPGAFSALAGRFQEGDETALNGREQIWTYSIHTLSNAGLLHMVTGTGYNSAAVILPPAMEPGSWNYHNEYLNNLMDGGLIGLGTFVLLLGVMWRLISKTDHPLKNVMRGWLVFLIVAGFSGVISGLHVFWLLLGAVCGAIAAQQVPSAMKSSSPLDLFDNNSYNSIRGSVQELPQSRSFSHRGLSAYRNWRNAIHKSVQEDLRNIGR